MCGDIVEHLPLAQSTVSQHLKILKESGLIRGTMDGPRVCYCVEPKELKRLKELVAGLERRFFAPNNRQSTINEIIGDTP